MESLDNQCFISFIFQKKEETLNTLANQELKILKLASTDLTNKEISNQLCISDQTVKKTSTEHLRKTQPTRHKRNTSIFATYWCCF